MSQIPASPSIYSSPSATEVTTAARRPVMAGTQTLQSLSLPFFASSLSASELQPVRIQLPPLTIPPPPHRLEYSSPGMASELVRHQTPSTTQPSSPRTYSRSSIPLSSLLSPIPYAPRRSDALDLPKSPPRSAIDLGSHQSHHKDARRFHGSDYRRQSVHQPPCVQRRYQQQLQNTVPSLTSSNVPQYIGTYPKYCYPEPPRLPPQISRSLSSGPQSYNALGPMPPPPRIVPSVPSPPQLPAQVRKCYESKFVPKLRHQQPAYRNDELHYELKVRQQPIAARACGFGERDRRSIDPPPVVQLSVTDSHNRQVDLDELRYSLHVAHCTLWSSNGMHEETALMQPDRRATHRLVGQLVASPAVAKDEYDVEGCFFCFPDMSCRTHGRYRLRFVLMRIDPANLYVGGTSPILTEVLSDVFTVYTAKDFPGIRDSSALTRALKLQGCNIQVKKGNERSMARKRSAVATEKGEDAEAGLKRPRN